MSSCCAISGLTAGRIDARFTGYTQDLLTETAQGDPEGPAVGGAFTALLNEYNHDELKFGADEDYHNTSNGSAAGTGRAAAAADAAAASRARRTCRAISRRR